MSITYKLNKEKNGVEIKFTEKPSEKVRAKLKALGFRWSQFNGVWYAKQSEETIAYAKELASEEGEQISLNIVEAETETEVDEVEVEVDEKPIEEVIKEATRKVVENNSKKTEPKKAEPKKVADKHKNVSAKPSTTPTKAESKAEPKKDNIVIFPKARPDVKVAVTEGNATYEDCKAKLEAERKIFCDSDSQFVIDGILKMCEINSNFRNNVMRADKTYEGAFKYFMEMARKGYALQYNGVTYLDNNIALGFAMDYFNEAEVPSNVINGIVKEG